MFSNFGDIAIQYHIDSLLRGKYGGLKFDSLPPLSCDDICIPSQVWSTDFLFEKGFRTERVR